MITSLRASRLGLVVPLTLLLLSQPFAPRRAAAMTPRDMLIKAGKPTGKPVRILPKRYNRSLRPLTEGPITQIEHNNTLYPHMTEAAYADLRNAMMEALKRYPPDKHFFIGLGSDPAPLIAFLQNAGGRDLAINFPASGKVYENGVAPEVMAPYVDKLIPRHALRGDKTIVLIDQTGMGRTLKQLGPIFRTYLESIGSRAEVVQLAFSDWVQGGGNERIDTTHFGEVNKFLYSPYEEVTAQYPRHILGRDPIEQLVERPQYLQFKAAMLERMQRDKVFESFRRRLNLGGRGGKD